MTVFTFNVAESHIIAQL